MDKTKLLLGDSLETLKTLDANSIDAMVTDPPAGISFMGKTWDSHKGGRKEWIAWLCEVMEEALRVMKPGAYGLVWALPRTSHWTGMALEDAGFEVRDCVYHLFGSGFPKSLNVGKAIDKLQGNEREIVGTQMLGGNAAQTTKEKGGTYASNTDAVGVKPIEVQLTKGQTEWEGWGTALKPAVECWWLVRKPLEESTVAKNVLEYGTGALNIDASRIGTDDSFGGGAHGASSIYGADGAKPEGLPNQTNEGQGRWPSHLIHDGSDEVLEHFPQVAGKKPFKKLTGYNFDVAGENKDQKYESQAGLGEIGSAARFFYCAKPSRRERNEGLDDKTNGHPTVKSQSLMKYLIRLITPPDGVVLDPFMGSGSTGVACKTLGYDFVGIELDAEYLEIAKARIDHAKPLEVVEQLDILKQQDSD